MKKKLANMSQNLFLMRTHIRTKSRHEWIAKMKNTHKAKKIRTKNFIREISSFSVPGGRSPHKEIYRNNQDV